MAVCGRKREFFCLESVQAERLDSCISRGGGVGGVTSDVDIATGRKHQAHLKDGSYQAWGSGVCGLMRKKQERPGMPRQ